jgi:peptide/nickel transport system substrate-binding protein
VTFHDGQPLDSAAVKANLERSKSVGDAAGSTVRAAAAEIASVDTPDSSTVTINLTKPDGGFVYALGTQIGMMISPSSLDGSAGLDLDPVGAGPYVAEDFKPTDTATFARFDDYWDDSEERPAKFVVKYVTDATTRLNAVRSGQSTVSLITPSQLSTAESSGLEVVVNPTSSRWTLYLNTSRVMKDERIRQAMMYAIDRESIASALSFDTGEPTVSLIPGGAPGSIEDAEADYPYDVEKAKELMSEAGYPDGGLTISYILLNSPEYSQLTDVLQEQLAAIGIKLDVSQIDISQAASFTAGTGDMMLARWGGRADQLATLNVVVGPDGTYAPGGVVTPELEQALQQAGQFSIDDPQRAVALQDANQETISQAATVPIMTRANIYAFKPGCVAGLEEYLASGSNDWRDVTVSSGC